MLRRLRVLASLSLALLALLAPFASCKSSNPRMNPREVPEALANARTELGRGDTQSALYRLRAAANTPGLETALRDEVQRTLEAAAEKRIDELSTPQSDPDDLAELVDLDLPRQLAVTAGLRAARLYFDQGEALDGYRLVRKLDTKFPQHFARAAAGDLLIEIGLWLVDNGTGWLGIGHSTDDAQEVLEYVILQHPSAARSDDAYDALARIYADDLEWDLAIERLEFLVLYHPNSPLRVGAQARIPHLRLRSLTSPEYDRAELLKARGELETWLNGWSGHELERDVRLDLADCQRRIIDSDLIIARFYRRVGNVHGARSHAERALATAREAAETGREKAAQSFLDEVGPDPVAAAGAAQ